MERADLEGSVEEVGRKCITNLCLIRKVGCGMLFYAS